jgi:hypothetical protein
VDNIWCTVTINKVDPKETPKEVATDTGERPDVSTAVAKPAAAAKVAGDVPVKSAKHWYFLWLK